MKYLSIILLILITGCATQKRCLIKFPPQVDTISVSHLEYRDTIIYRSILGDTIYVESEWQYPWDDGYVEEPPVKVKIKPIYAEVELAKAKSWIDGNKLKMELIQKDSILRFKLDSAIRMNSDTIRIEKIVSVPVKSSPFFKFGFFIVLGLLILFGSILILRK